MTFEENAEEIASDVASLGFDLPELIEAEKLAVDYVRVERSEIEETGEYDLEGLFVRLDYAIQTVGAKRVVLDTIESLFAGLKDDAILRAELRRLFRWLKDQGVTAVITGERGEGLLTRHGLEEYVSDAVILLDHRVHDQVSTRRLRVVKYRGSHHGTNEYPFLIDADGISVLPVSSHGARSTRRRSSACRRASPRLDEMLGGKGYYPRQHDPRLRHRRHRQDQPRRPLSRRGVPPGRTLPVLSLRGVAAAAAPQHALHRHRPRAVGDERRCCSFTPTGRRATGSRPISSTMHQVVADFRPTVAVIDPVTNLMTVGTFADVQAMLTRMIDHLKTENITAMLTSLMPGQTEIERTETTISSLMDTLDRARERRDRRPAPPRAVRAQVSRHGALERSSRVRADGSRLDICANGGVRRARRMTPHTVPEGGDRHAVV